MVVKRKKKFWVVGATVAVAVTLGMTTTGCSFKSKGTSKTSDYVAEDVKNKIIYQKNGGLYYADLKEDKEPALIYDSGNADSCYTCKYTKDGKYFYFFNDTDKAKNLYQVDVGKLTFSEEKNKKNLKIVSSDISMEEQSHDADFELVDTDTLVYENEKDHGVYLYNGKENKLLAENAFYSKSGIAVGDNFLYKQEDKENYFLYDMKTGKSKETDIPSNTKLIERFSNDFSLMVPEDEQYVDIYWAKNGENPVLMAEHIDFYAAGGINFPIDYTEGSMYIYKDMEQEITYYDFVEDPYADEADMYDSDYSNYGDEDDDDEDEDDEDDDEDDDDEDDEDEDEDDEDDEDDDEDESSIEEQNNNTEGSILGTQSIDEIREDLKKQKYSLNQKFKDLYYSDKDSGSEWIASGVLRVAGDPKNHVCIYQKLDYDTKLCNIDELENQWDFDSLIKEQPPEFKAYAYVDGINQELSEISSGETIETGGIKSSEDGKWYVISVGDGTKNGNNQLMMFEKTSEGLKKTDFTAKNTKLDSCSWEGNDLYYYENGNYCKYSNGKSSVIFKNASDVEQQPDGMYLLKTDIDGQETFSLADKNFEIQPIESKLTENSSIYVNSKCILYMAGNEDGEGSKLYLYTGGKENRLIDSDVQFCWCNGEYVG